MRQCNKNSGEYLATHTVGENQKDGLFSDLRCWHLRITRNLSSSGFCDQPTISSSILKHPRHMSLSSKQQLPIQGDRTGLLLGLFIMLFSQKHGITIAKETVFLFNGLFIGIKNMLFPSKGTHQH